MAWAVGLVGALLAPVAGGAGAPPSFVVVVADDLDLVLGTVDFLPTVGQLAAAGTTFERYLVPTSLCCPGRTTLLTGRYVHGHGVYTNTPPAGGWSRFESLGLEGSTLADALAARGYRTALFGKFLNGYEGDPDDLDVPAGWSEWFGVVAGNGYSNYGYTLNEGGTLVTYGAAEGDYLTDVLAGHALAVVARAVAAEEPFFLYFAPYVPHAPATPAPRHADLFDGERAPRTASFNEDDVSDKPRAIASLAKLTLAEIVRIDRRYRDRLRSMQAVDEALAALREQIALAGRLDSTYFLFTTDNGYHMGQHRLAAGKALAYEEDVLGPLVVSGPGVAAGRTVTALASATDLAPTLLELASASASWPLDGRSLAPLWGVAPPAAWRAAVHLEMYPYDGGDDEETAARQPSLFAAGAAAEGVAEPEPTFVGLRSDELKYVEWSTGERELYFLAVDPAELDNRAACASTALLAGLAARTAALHACSGAGCAEAEDQAPLLADGFECGGLQAWSAAVL